MRAVAQLAAPIRGVADFSRLVSEDYRQYRRTIWTAWAAAAVLAWVSAAALWQWRTAIVQRDRAVHAEGAANKANAEAQANAKQARDNAAEAGANLLAAQLRELRFLADEASQQRTVDTGTAALVALEALPDAATGNNRPYVPEAELQLDGALRDLREQLVLGHEGVSTDGAFTPDGKRIVTGSLDKLKRFMTAEAAMISAADARGGCGARRSAQTASVSSPRSMTRRRGSGTRRPAIVYSAAFSPDGKRIVTASQDKTARVWDLFPDTQALVSAAKAAVPRCLTQEQRKSFFLPPEPPAWCIEMAKWPYDKPEWKQWLANKRAGKNPSLPAAQ